MIDLLEISIQFDSSLVECVDDRHALIGVDLKDLDIPLGAKSIHWTIDDDLGVSGLYHPYESLPTSYTGMALKVNFDGYFYPHVTIKASPAKILQGHNVFGTDNLELCVTEMMYWLQSAYPALFSLLAINTAEVRKMDITYMSRVGSQKLLRKAIDFMTRISNGQTKPTKSKKYETTAYWGGATSRLIRLKCYGKYEEFLYQLDKFQDKAKKGDAHALKIVNSMSDTRIQDIARTSLRWECTVMKRYLERNDIPVNVWDMIKHQKDNPNFLTDLWQKGFKSIFDAMRGQEMTIVNDDEVLKRLKSTFQTVTKSGKVSYRKAINLFGFYSQLKAIGYDEMKAQKLLSHSQFNRLVSDLITAGFSKAYLQNLHIDDGSTVISFVNLIEIDFSQQVPDWYVEPVATPLRLAS